jgi:hypothetical protein
MYPPQNPPVSPPAQPNYKAIQNRDRFLLEITIDGMAYKTVPTALNKESLIALLTIATTVNWPRIGGWNIYTESGEPLANVNAMEFVTEMANATPLGKKAGDKGAAGWSAVPVVTPVSADFRDLLEQAKREGRVPR